MDQPGLSARDRVIVGAVDMIGRRGLRATSVRDLVKYAQAPLGSTYHYFPGGKQQLASEAVRFNGVAVCQLMTAGLCDGSLGAVKAFFSAARELMLGTEFQGGCAILAVAVEGMDAGEVTPALASAAEAFTSWEELIAKALSDDGIAEDGAKQIATVVVAAAEGAIALCRAKQMIEPLNNVAAQIEALITYEIDQRISVVADTAVS